MYNVRWQYELGLFADVVQPRSSAQGREGVNEVRKVLPMSAAVSAPGIK